MHRPNLSRLKSGGKEPTKQETISKFFSVIADKALDAKEKEEAPSKHKKRKSEFNGDSQKELKRARSIPSDDPLSSSGFTVIKAGQKQSSAAPDTADTGEPSSVTPGRISQNTATKLHSFASSSVSCNGDESRKQDVTIDDIRRTFSGRGSKFIDLDQTAGSSQASGDAMGTSDAEDEPHPSTSAASSNHLSKFSHGGTSSHNRPKDTSSRASSSSKIGQKTKYTPLEQQFVEIKAKYADAILFVECGYKYRFFGDDAEIAAKELKIFCHLDHNFMTASIPVHRLYVHVRRLVATGHKVGVVKQMETAALKAAGENRSAPFTRQLTALYTKSTLIGEDVDPVLGNSRGETDSPGVTTSSHLMCIYEPDPVGKRGQPHTVAMVAVQPSTGELVYDSFEDTSFRSELETRLCHVQPVELLLPQSLSDSTDKLVKQQVSVSATPDDRLRVERLADETYQWDRAVEGLTQFYGDTDVTEVLKLPKPVISCLHGLLTYLRDFNLDKVLKLTSNFKKFSADSKNMHLGSQTLRNLEVFTNLTDGKEKGSLVWVLDQTVTKFGSRLLRTWIACPLLDTEEIEARLSAVSEIVAGACPLLTKVRELLVRLPDLEKGLCTIYHRKCSTVEFLTVCKALNKVYGEISVQQEVAQKQLKSPLLRRLLTELPGLLDGISVWASALDEKAARDGDKTQLFTDETQFPVVVQRKKSIAGVLEELHEHRREFRLTLRAPSLDYVTVTGTEFMVEVKNSNLKLVPTNWVKICSTKALSRFHTPFIVSATKRLGQLREQLQKDCSEAWLSFLGSFEECYAEYRKAVQHLAVLDCLFSLAAVAQQDGYCRPVIHADSAIHIEQGRHPVVDVLLGEQQQFVPNDTNLQASGPACMVITGPNMGGKSSYIKQVALVCILAQIGSYVPAQSARLGILDAVYARMGAADELFKGRSTFMVELQEAAEIMKAATSRSLVILDELGRGTSTHDGVAIAHATLRFFVEEVKCLTLFVTHYPPLAQLENVFPVMVKNYHMSFMVREDEQTSDSEDSGAGDVITFLYQLVPGMAGRSYGLNVARLAQIPHQILAVGAKKSAELERKVANRREEQILFAKLCSASVPGEILSLIHQLHAHSTGDPVADTPETR